MAELAVFAVHVTRPDEGAGAVEVIFGSESEARRYAKDRSRDARFLAASVTRYHLGVFGSRHPVCWFVDGVEADPRAPRHYYGTDAPVSVEP